MSEDSLSAEIYMDLMDKEYPRWHVLGEPSPFFRYYHQYQNWESYGKESKRFTWAKLSSDYKWEDCI